MNTSTPDLQWIFPEKANTKSVTGRIRGKHSQQRCFRCGFDNDTGRHHNRLVDYAPREYELIYILKGRGTYTDETGLILPFEDFSVLQRFPNRVHTLHYDPESQEVITCYITVPEEMFNVLKMCGAIYSKSPIIQYKYDKLLIQKMQKIFFIIRDSGKPQLPEMTSAVYNFVLFFLNQLAWSDSPRNSNKLFEKACKIISEHISEKLLMPEVAESLGMNYKTFRRLFEKHCGISPGQYRIELRIDRARDMLNSGMQAKEVAGKLNYPDVYCFAKQFKRFTGITPAQYHKHT